MRGNRWCKFCGRQFTCGSCNSFKRKNKTQQAEAIAEFHRKMQKAVEHVANEMFEEINRQSVELELLNIKTYPRPDNDQPMRYYRIDGDWSLAREVQDPSAEVGEGAKRRDGT